MLRDRSAGFTPFMVAATGGTTNAGVVDPIAEIADVAAREGLWFHVDAAWGGAAVLVPELRRLLEGIERADSITFDAHKWLSVPMAAGCLAAQYVVGWVIEKKAGQEWKKLVLKSIQPVGEGLKFSDAPELLKLYGPSVKAIPV